MKHIISIAILSVSLQAQPPAAAPAAQQQSTSKLLTAEASMLEQLYSERAAIDQKIRRIESEACMVRQFPVDRCRVTAEGVMRLPDPPKPAAAKDEPKK